MISYEDFDLRISADGAGFKVSALRGSQTTSGPFFLDPSRFCEIWKLADAGPVEIAEPGSELFEALIRGDVRNLYHQGRGGAGADAAKGLRVRILIDPHDERLRPFLRVPWEILFDRSADSGGLLALDPRRPIVRVIDSREETLSPSTGPLRRVLLATANPRHLAPLDLDEECARVENALASLDIRPAILGHATCNRLHDSIRDGEPQIFHFMGHGTFDPELGEGVLLLENDKGGRDSLRASTLANFFAGKPAPRLVILASCFSAHLGDLSSGPFASAAAALVAAGLPAVVAMQTKVRDRSAVRFTDRLYQRLAQGDPIEAAVSDARLALLAGREEVLDWAVPVLFVRGQTAGSPVGEEPVAPPAPPPQERNFSVSQVINNQTVRNQVNTGYVKNQRNNFS